ncbi:MAG: hypothetical protein JW937_04215, partial [Candidatus Omnitrophica bacterium]|nr:hypothetical protein [Candidatus Omnitrophota bacterium]
MNNLAATQRIEVDTHKKAFVEGLGARISSLKSALIQYLSDPSDPHFSSACQESHKLAGISGLYGFESLAGALVEYERRLRMIREERSGLSHRSAAGILMRPVV